MRHIAKISTTPLPPHIKESPIAVEFRACEQTCCPVTIKATLNIAGMKLTANAFKKLLVRNNIPSAHPTITSTKQLIAKLARPWISA